MEEKTGARSMDGKMEVEIIGITRQQDRWKEGSNDGMEM